MCHIVFISHSLCWRYIKIALQEYVIIIFITRARSHFQTMFRQFLTRFSMSDWFLAMLKISAEHGSGVSVGSSKLETENNNAVTTSSRKLFLLFMVTIKSAAFAWTCSKSMKHNF